MQEKEQIKPESIIDNELYNALILNKSVCSSNSIAFKEVLTKIGMDVKTIGVANKENGAFHMCNLVLLNEEYYIFDSTLDQSIYDDHANQKEIFLCVAGLGEKTYNKFYELINELVSPVTPPKSLPKNIAQFDIPKSIVNPKNTIIKKR